MTTHTALATSIQEEKKIMNPDIAVEFQKLSERACIETFKRFYPTQGNSKNNLKKLTRILNGYIGLSYNTQCSITTLSGHTIATRQYEPIINQRLKNIGEWGGHSYTMPGSLCINLQAKEQIEEDWDGIIRKALLGQKIAYYEAPTPIKERIEEWKDVVKKCKQKYEMKECGRMLRIQDELVVFVGYSRNILHCRGIQYFVDLTDGTSLHAQVDANNDRAGGIDCMSFHLFVFKCLNNAKSYICNQIS